MNKIQIKKSFQIFLLIIIIFFLLIFIKNFFKSQKITEEIISNNNGVREYKKTDEIIILFNDIINNSTKYDDYKNCDKIKNEIDLKENCISQIKFKFDKINLAKDINDCNLLESTNEKTSEERKDICFLNLNYKLKNIKICDEIKNLDLKQLCISQNNLN